MLKQILRAQIPYVHLLISGILSAALFLGLSIANVFIWWSLYGEGESSNGKYHPTANIIISILPVGIVSLILLLLLSKSYCIGKLPQAKSFTISVIFIFALFVLAVFAKLYSY